MLKQWLSDAAYGEFLHSRKQREAFATASVKAIDAALFDWSVLDRVLRSEPAPDVIVVRRSELLELPAPRDQEGAKQLLSQGIGLVVRQAQAHETGLSTIVRDFEAELDSRIHLQLFVTAAQTHGFGWHYDPDDVLILQTIGRKKYYFRANTQKPRFTPGLAPDFRLIERETSPLLACTLHAGDALYLPRGMWHVAQASTDSLSMSLGLEAPAR
jgi:50S ribosomal protein L16 3-hydroxylase